MSTPLWSRAETAILRANYLIVGAAGCALLLPERTATQCRNRASKAGISIPKPKTARESFERKFSVTPGCWPWCKGRSPDGYGQFKFKNKAYPASRFSYILYVGPVPAHLKVCHKCDNPSCVNPDHLFLGTDKENAEDRQRKGRSAMNFGMAQGTSKLSDAQVLEIRAAKDTQRSLAKRFGVSQASISCIKSGVHWPHLPGAVPPAHRKEGPGDVAINRSPSRCASCGHHLGQAHARGCVFARFTIRRKP